MPASMDLSRSASPDTARLARKIGYVTAVISSVFGGLYLLGLVVNLSTNGTFYPAAEPVQLFSAVIAIAWNQVLVVLMVALRWLIPERRRIFADLGLAFTLLQAAMSSITWFVRLAIVPGVGDPAVLALLTPYSPGSVLFAVEMLGWGLFYGLAVLFAAFAFAGGRLEAWIRALLAASGILSLLHAVGIATAQPVLNKLGYPAWGLLLPAATVLLALWFRKQ